MDDFDDMFDDDPELDAFAAITELEAREDRGKDVPVEEYINTINRVYSQFGVEIDAEKFKCIHSIQTMLRDFKKRSMVNVAEWSYLGPREDNVFLWMDFDTRLVLRGENAKKLGNSIAMADWVDLHYMSGYFGPDPEEYQCVRIIFHFDDIWTHKTTK